MCVPCTLAASCSRRLHRDGALLRHSSTTRGLGCQVTRTWPLPIPGSPRQAGSSDTDSKGCRGYVCTLEANVLLCPLGWGRRGGGVSHLEAHDFHYLKYLLKTSGTYESSSTVVFWGLAIISFKYEHDSCTHRWHR